MHNKRFLVKTGTKQPMIFVSKSKVKIMNKVIKILITESIHNNILIASKTQTGDRYIILNKQDQEILSVNNSWATNNYSIFVNRKPVLSVRWDETNSRPLDSEQKDMLDIINICKEKIDPQETVQTMSQNELETANFLQKSLCSASN